MQETQEPWIPSLGQEDPLEEERATTPVFLPGKSHGKRSLAGYSPWGRRVRHDWAHTHSPGKEMGLWAPWWPAQGHPTDGAELGLLWLMVPSAMDKCHRMWKCEQLWECIKDLRTRAQWILSDECTHTLFCMHLWVELCPPKDIVTS